MFLKTKNENLRKGRLNINLHIIISTARSVYYYFTKKYMGSCTKIYIKKKKDCEILNKILSNCTLSLEQVRFLRHESN